MSRDLRVRPEKVNYDEADDVHSTPRTKTLAALTMLRRRIKKLAREVVFLERTVVSKGYEESHRAYASLCDKRQRLLALQRKLDKIKGEPSSSSEGKVSFSVNGAYPIIGQELSKKYNSDGKYPDFLDVERLVQNLFDSGQVKCDEGNIRAIAKTYFSQFGMNLQRKRLHEDYTFVIEQGSEEDNDLFNALMGRRGEEKSLKDQAWEVVKQFTQRYREVRKASDLNDVKKEPESSTEEEATTSKLPLGDTLSGKNSRLHPSRNKGLVASPGAHRPNRPEAEIEETIIVQDLVINEVERTRGEVSPADETWEQKPNLEACYSAQLPPDYLEYFDLRRLEAGVKTWHATGAELLAQLKETHMLKKKKSSKEKQEKESPKEKQEKKSPKEKHHNVEMVILKPGELDVITLSDEDCVTLSDDECIILSDDELQTGSDDDCVILSDDDGEAVSRSRAGSDDTQYCPDEDLTMDCDSDLSISSL